MIEDILLEAEITGNLEHPFLDQVSEIAGRGPLRGTRQLNVDATGDCGVLASIHQPLKLPLVDLAAFEQRLEQVSRRRRSLAGAMLWKVVTKLNPSSRNPGSGKPKRAISSRIRRMPKPTCSI